jgi:U3 small nucleolar ribonucleoprotein component
LVLIEEPLTQEERKPDPVALNDSVYTLDKVRMLVAVLVGP